MTFQKTLLTEAKNSQKVIITKLQEIEKELLVMIPYVNSKGLLEAKNLIRDLIVRKEITHQILERVILNHTEEA